MPQPLSGHCAELWGAAEPWDAFGSWGRLGVPRQGAQEGAAGLCWCPQVWFVGGWEQCLSLAELLGPTAQVGAWLWRSRKPLAAAQPSRPAHPTVPSAPGREQRRSGRGVTLLQPRLCHVRSCPAPHAGSSSGSCSWALADSAALGPCAEAHRAAPAAPSCWKDGLPAWAVPILQHQPCCPVQGPRRGQGAQKAFGPWARCRGCLCNTIVALAALPADTLLGLSFTSSGQVFSIALRRAWGIFPSPFPSYRQGRTV